MKHFFLRALTVLMTVGILLGTSSLAVMADEFTGDTRNANDPYALTKDSSHVCIVEFLDENDQPLPQGKVFYGSQRLSFNEIFYTDSEFNGENENAIDSTNRSLLGIDKFKLRFSIREDVELCLKQGDFTQIVTNPDFFDDCAPIEAGAISDVYTLDGGPLEFYVLFDFGENKYISRFTVGYLEPGVFELSFAFSDTKSGAADPDPKAEKTILIQDAEDAPVVCYADAEQLDRSIVFYHDNCRMVSINGLQKIVDKDNYPLSGHDSYLTLEYIVNGESESRTSRVIIREEGKELWKNPFTDVKDTDLFYNSLSYCYRNGLLNGTSATEFSPDSNANRAMIVTTLYRIAGSPEVNGGNHFVDVPADQWYTDAVIWASANGIVNGYDSEHFGPMDVITREQFATILYRYAKMLYPEMTLDNVSPNNEMYIAECGMVIEASDYAREALAVAAENYILGLENDDYYPFNIYPKEPVTRADLANGLYGLNRSLLVRAGSAN